MLRSLIVSLVSAIFAAIPAQAATVSLSGYFAGCFDPSGPGYQGISTFSATWSLTYDDAAVPSSGPHEQTVPLASISTSTVIGLTTFTTANSSASLTFTNGQLSAVWIGGSTSGVTYSSPEIDDFSLAYFSPTNVGIMSLSVGSRSGADMAFSRSGNYTAVPEPSAALLGAVGALALLRRRR